MVNLSLIVSLLPDMRVVILLWIVLHCQIIICKGAVVGDCIEETEGSRCHAPSQIWQHDGVCVKHTEGAPGECVVPDSREFKLAIVARWTRLRKFIGIKSVTKMWMRGSGPGLSWEKSIELKRLASSSSSWRAELSYTSGSSSLRCTSSSHCSMNQGSLEFRLYKDELATEGMMGPNFFIPLPVSHSLSGSADYMIPSVTVYPWFDGNEVRVASFDHVVGASVTGTPGEIQFKVSVLLPPSFDHNIHITYPVVILFGKKEPQLIPPLLEHLFVHEATVKEVVTVVIDYIDEAPFCSLSPFSAMTKVYICSTGKECHDCQSCWDDRRAERCYKEEFMEKARRCLYGKVCVTRGDEILDAIELELLPKIQEQHAQNRLLLDFPRNRLTIIGMDGAGLLACYAAISRPWHYGNAGCLSAPFHWPMPGPDVGRAYIKHAFSEANKMKKSYAMLYLTQKYYVDNGADDGFYFPTVDFHGVSQTFVDELQRILGLRLNENIMYANIPGLTNSYYHDPYYEKRMLQSVRYPLSFFFRTDGGPNEKHTAMLNIKESEYAKVVNTEHEIVDEEKETTTNGNVEIPEIAGKQDEPREKVRWIQNHSTFDFCDKESNDKGMSVPVPIFLALTGLTVLISVLVTVMIMCLRDSNRRAVEEAEKEEAELMDGVGSSDEEL